MSTAESAPDAAALLERVRAAADGGRVMVGIAGCPGAGKSTVASWLVRALDPGGRAAVRVPMDGFHLAQAELVRLGRDGRKGSIDTFDGDGYLALLRRLAVERERTVYAPAFDRGLEEPVAGAIAVDADARFVVTEGNYLLDAQEPWASVPDVLTQVWYCDADEAVRLERLRTRHERFGRSAAQARAWIEAVDEPNARRIRRSRCRADVTFDVDALGIDP